MLLSGTTCIRNAILYDYPFRESCLSALPVCDEFVIVCAPSTDGTESLCEEIAAGHQGIVRVVYDDWWKPELQRVALGEGARIGLAECQGEWRFYIQADEALHEDELSNIRQAAEHPTADWYDWGHIDFWLSYEQFLDNQCHLRRARMVRSACYPAPVSVFDDGAILTGPKERMGDMTSRVHLYHYGSVRQWKPFLLKQRGIAELAGNPTWVADIDSVLNGLTHYRLPEQPPGVCAPFTGTHPQVMQEWMAARREQLETGKLG